MPTKRRTEPGFAAVWRKGVCAGSIDSRSGKPNVTPQPRRNVRRGICFLVMNIYLASVGAGFSRRGPAKAGPYSSIRAFFHFHPHLEWSTLDDTQHDR